MVEVNRVERLENGVMLDMRTDLPPAPRPRLSQRGVYLPKQYRKYREQLAQAISPHIPATASVYHIRLTVYRDIPIGDKRYGDVDNLVKTVMDALPVDDVRVAKISAVKRVGEPRVILTVRWGDE